MRKRGGGGEVIDLCRCPTSTNPDFILGLNDESGRVDGLTVRDSQTMRLKLLILVMCVVISYELHDR